MTEATPPTPEPSGAPSHGGTAPAKIEKESVWEVYYPFNSDRDKDAVPIASFPMIIYFWPTSPG